MTGRQGSLSVCRDEEGYGGPRTEQAHSATWSPSGHPRLQSAQEHLILLRPAGTFPEMNREDPGSAALFAVGTEQKTAASEQICGQRMSLPDQKGFPGGSVVKTPPANAGDTRDLGRVPGLEDSPGGGHGHPLQYSCLESRQRSLVGYSPWGHKESDH